ncbi:MAG: hypothetical protein R2762_31300, partial [Bryobacteraceae bacterium]
MSTPFPTSVHSAPPVSLAGIDYRDADAGIRAELSFGETDLGEFLDRFRRSEPQTELVVLCTCNRTEFYLAPADGPAWQGAPSDSASSRPMAALMSLLRRLRPHARALDRNCLRYQTAGSEAAMHLFRVTAGLESRLLGDTQISSQVRRALQAAQAAGTARLTLRTLFESALRASRRVRRDTGLCRGSAGIGGAVVRSIADARGPGARLTALVLGAGQAANDIANHLAKTGRFELTVSARRAEQADAAAVRTGARVASWSEVQGLLTAVDVVVAATSSRLDILGVATLTAAAAARRAPLLVIDAGVPANADPKIGEIAGVTLVGLDQLAREQGRALAERERHIPVAEAILDAELMRWSDRRNLAVVEPAIKNLYIEAARIRAELLGSIGRGDVERATHLLLR